MKGRENKGGGSMYAEMQSWVNQLLIKILFMKESIICFCLTSLMEIARRWYQGEVRKVFKNETKPTVAVVLKKYRS